jgi:hypothetical protein
LSLPCRPSCSASANNFYNTQKTGLETVSAKVRDILKEMVTSTHKRIWKDGGTLTVPTAEQAVARMDRLFLALNALRGAAPDSPKYLMTKAEDLATSINDQRLQMALQVSNSLSWPFMTILIAWASLLFFGFGTLARVNRTSVIGLAVGAASVASAIFLIVELSTLIPAFSDFRPSRSRRQSRHSASSC